MTTLQKVIKYLALAFAIFIIVNIISCILFGIYTFANLLGLKKTQVVQEENLQEINYAIESANTKILKIDLQYTNLKIQKGDTLKVESNTSNITCTQNNNQLIIKEKGHSWFTINEKDASQLVISVPEEMVFNKVNIDAGAGEIYIETLNTNELNFEMGAGKVEIHKLNVNNRAKIDGGAGKIELMSGEIANLDLDMGVGECILNTKLNGNNDIDAGIGKLEIDLTNNIEDYTIKVSKGIGSITIDGKEASNDTVYGTGDTNIKVDGGIGAIIIK